MTGTKEKFFLFGTDAGVCAGRAQKIGFYAWNFGMLIMSAAGICTLTLMLGVGNVGKPLFFDYLGHPLVFFLNFLPIFLFELLIYCLVNRSWIAFLVSSLVFVTAGVGNYFKLMFRDDPFMFSDISAIHTALGVSSNYNITLTKRIAICLVCVIIGTLLLLGEGYRTFPVTLYNEFVGEVSQNKGFASAIGIVAIVITCVIYIIQNIATAKTSFAMSALNPVPKKKPKGIAGVLVHLYIYIVTGISILPQMYVAYCSFRNTSGQLYVDGYSFQSYREMFGKLGSSVVNTIKIPVISLAFILVFAVLIAYISVRRRNPLTGAVDMISMIPYIIPGTVVGIAMVSSFNRPPLILTATTAIMIISLVIRRLPYTIRSSVATLQQIPLSIEEAAISLGSSKLKTFIRITVPMMSSGIIAGAILSWVTLVTELSTAIFLYTARTQTLTVAIYTQIVRGHYGVASAMATLLTGITIVSMIIFNIVSPDGDVTL